MTQSQIQEIASNAAKVALCAYFKKSDTELFKKGFGASKTQQAAVSAVSAVLEKAFDTTILQKVRDVISSQPFPDRLIELTEEEAAIHAGFEFPR